MHNSKNNNYKTIRIYNSSFEQMNTVCKQYSLTKTELIEVFLNYFDKTKIDPREISDVSTEVKKLKNQLISFIRKQEKDKLDPLVKKQDILINECMKFHKETNSQNKNLKKSLTNNTNSIIKNQLVINEKLNKIINAR